MLDSLFGNVVLLLKDFVESISIKSHFQVSSFNWADLNTACFKILSWHCPLSDGYSHLEFEFELVYLPGGNNGQEAANDSLSRVYHSLQCLFVHLCTVSIPCSDGVC